MTLFLGILVVLFGGIAMALHKANHTPGYEIFAWMMTFAFFLLFEASLHTLR